MGWDESGEWVDDHEDDIVLDGVREEETPTPHVLTKNEQSRGGRVAANRMTPEQRRARAQKAGKARKR